MLTPLFKGCPFSPNMLTMFSLAIAIIGFILVIYNYYEIAVITFILAIFMDAVDGMVARAKGLSSNKGAFLDGIVDRLVEFIILGSMLMINLPFMVIPAYVWIILVLFFGTLMTSFVRAYAVYNKVISYEHAKAMGGLLERTERMILIVISLIAFVFNPLYTVWLLGLIAFLSFATFLERVYYVLKD